MRIWRRWGKIRIERWKRNWEIKRRKRKTRKRERGDKLGLGNGGEKQNERRIDENEEKKRIGKEISDNK